MSLILPIVEFVSPVWFLVRVIPKPSRATYPSQRMTFPLASGFIIWLLSVAGSVMAFRRTWLNAEEKITSDFIFTEGPAADINGDVYLSDIPNNRIHKWDVDAKKLSTFREDSGGSNGLFFDKKGLFLACEGSDGMTIDNEGNIYLTTNAIVVYNKKGEKIETIEVTEGPANVCFGGKDKKTLFITARKSLYAVRMRVNGVK